MAVNSRCLGDPVGHFKLRCVALLLAAGLANCAAARSQNVTFGNGLAPMVNRLRAKKQTEK